MINKNSLIIIGFVLLSAGILLSIYVYSINQRNAERNQIIEKIKEGNTLLNQKSQKSGIKALSIFTELSSKENHKDLQFDIQYGLANALERNKDSVLALEIYEKLNQYPNLSKIQREKVSYSLGNILLSMNREEEGKSHLNLVLQKCDDKKLRAKVFISLGDYNLKNNQYDEARKNFLLALQEDPGNTYGRLGWKMSLDLLGYTWDPYDLESEYGKIESQNYSQAKNKIVKKTYRSRSIKKAKANIYSKALSYYRKKKYWLAIKNFEKTLRITKSIRIKELSYYYISESFYSLGNSTDSLKFAQRVLSNKIILKDQAAFFRIGTIYFKNENYEKAVSNFEKAIANFPKTNYTEKAKKWKKESLELIAENKKFKTRDIFIKPN